MKTWSVSKSKFEETVEQTSFTTTSLQNERPVVCGQTVVGKQKLSNHREFWIIRYYHPVNVLSYI